ncbi:MAG: ATP-binding cassette domain-containing protein [Legionellales bacterium]|jgi:ATPase subunit of ABC transporter with duplicated ATPase domains
MLVSISDGAIAYVPDQYILSHINFFIFSGERVAILGDNGSGKSTLIKAILAESQVIKTGDWHVPKSQDIGYLDQHYGTLNTQQSVLECIETCIPAWTHIEVRRHLNDFLFRTNEEVNAKISILSGGEKARLSLAQIAAKTPKILILDEMTNNLDFETREHAIQVLKVYPGGIIAISHDQDFLQAINVGSTYSCKDGSIT